MFQLTLRGLLLLLVTGLFLAAMTFSTLFGWLAAAWLGLLLAIFLADWRLTPGPRAWVVERRHDERLSLAAWNRIEIVVRLRTGARALAAWARDEPPATFQIGESGLILPNGVRPGETQKFVYQVWPPRRGDYRFNDLHLRWESVLGLFRRQARFSAAETVKVYPNLVDVRKYDLLVRKNQLWELGLRQTRLLGAGTEFERLREYVPDDEYRRINWKATARRGKPITMEFQTERSQNLVALLDVGRVMRSPVGQVAKMDYAINAVLLLTYVATQKGDRVGVLTFADDVQQWLAPKTGKGQFHRMLELLYAVQGQPVEPDYDRAFGYFSTRQRRRSLVLIFTDLTGSLSTQSLVAQLSRLRRTHLPLLVTVSDPTVQRLARQTVSDSASLYERTVAENLLMERNLVLERLRRQGVLTLDVSADELTVAVINRYLELKARLLI
jgi:uncharacterized protein (DUF58 family)